MKCSCKCSTTVDIYSIDSFRLTTIRAKRIHNPAITAAGVTPSWNILFCDNLLVKKRMARTLFLKTLTTRFHGHGKSRE